MTLAWSKARRPRHHAATTALLFVCALVVLPARAVGQDCQPQWDDTFLLGGPNGNVHALAVFDEDGDGPQPPALFVGGSFTEVAGDPLLRIARWDGSTWSAVGDGMSGTVFSLAVFDPDGDGPEPEALYAVGSFRVAGMVSADRIARWNGFAWSAVGGGFNNVAYTLAVHDEDSDGPGLPALYAGGLFTTAGAVSANRVVRWDGVDWTPLSDGMNNFVNDLEVLDPDGAGPAAPLLFAGGGFTMAGALGASRVAAWNGADWVPLTVGASEGVNAAVYSLAAYDEDGAGPLPVALYLGGFFTEAAGAPVSYIARWDGSSFSDVAGGTDAPVRALHVFDDSCGAGGPGSLFAGGVFTVTGGQPAAHVARWDGAAWSGLGAGTNDDVLAFATVDEDQNGPNPPALYVGGEFTNAGGQLSRHVARWACPPAAEITTQPQSQTVCAGTGVTFNVAAQGSPPLSYQWRRDGAPLTGQTGATLVIDPVSLADAGSYDVVVTDACGSVTSEVAILAVLSGPTITQQPTPQAACDGGIATFTLEALGTAPVVVQWRHDGVPIAGATGQTLSIDPVTAADAGMYDAVVSDACGFVTSELVALTVETTPEIVSDPADQAVCAGASAVFSVLANGDGLVFQWRKDGAALPGATSTTLTIDPVSAADAGLYDVVVSNTCGDTISATAALSVDTGPAISQQPQPESVCNGSAAVFTVEAAGTPPLSYQWRLDGAPIPGANASTLTIDPAAPAAVGVYDVTISNPCGSITSDGAQLTVDTGPVISQPPVSQQVCPGAAAMLEVVASGTAPLAYEWRKDGQVIPGATSATLEIPSFGPTDVGDYDVTVTNACGSAASAPAALTLAEAPVITQPPQSASACTGTSVAFSVAAQGTTPLSYQWYRDGTPVAGATAASLTVDPVTPGDAGPYEVVVANACGSVTSAAAILSVQAGVEWVSGPEPQAACVGSLVQFTVVASGAPPVSYQWRKDGTPIDGATSEVLDIPSAALSDVGLYDVVIVNDCGEVVSPGAALTVGDGPVFVEVPQERSACLGQPVALTASAQGVAPLVYQWRLDGVPIAGATEATYLIDALSVDDVGVYDVVATDACGASTSSAAALSVAVEVVVVEAPASEVVCAGDALTLEVVVDGASPLTYAWYKDGVPIPGATNATYSVGAIGVDDVGTYEVVVSNACGAATSPPAAITVDPCTPVLAPPVNPTPLDGATEIRTDTLLHWDPAAGAISYDLHFGAEGALAFFGNTSSMYWPLQRLAAGETYYWQVISRDGVSETPGPVWSFTTAGVTDPDGDDGDSQIPAPPGPGDGGQSDQQSPDPGDGDDGSDDEPADDGTAPPFDELPDELTPPGCGAGGGCGAGFMSMLPLMVAGLLGMRRRPKCRR